MERRASWAGGTGNGLSETLIQTTSGRRRRRKDDREEEEEEMVMVCSSAWFSVVLPFLAIVRMQTHRRFFSVFCVCFYCLCNYQCRKKDVGERRRT